MDMEWFLFCLLLGLALFWLVRSRSYRRKGGILALVLIAMAGFSAAIWAAKTSREAKSHDQLLRSIPRQGRPDGYVSSDQCQACHPREYDTWHRTFHRTMTQVAGTESVVGDFHNLELELRGKTFRLERRGAEFWVDLEDPEWRPSANQPQAPRVQRRIGLLTGSHHMQVYWTPGRAGNSQMVFPFAWLIPDQRWVPFHDTFLRDPKIPPSAQTWNLNCINCHATAGQPKPDAQTRLLDTRTAELGIACEACHGAAQEHVRANQNPLRRYRLHGDDKADSTIVNPKRLAAQISSQACGQCHGIKWISDRNDWAQNGFQFRPGAELAPATPLVRPAKLESQPWLTTPLKQNPTFLKDHYWSDGMVRVSGREYNGLVESPCHERGELSCLSCHSMHQSDPDDQLAAGMNANQACVQCHKTIKPAEHSRHSAGSSGNECYNCHMPHTTYGLLKAIRSHQISSPNVRTDLQTGRPNACNLCHLDKSLAWTAKYLSEWYGQSAAELTEEQKNIAAALLWLLQGDAGQRALIAWSMGWDPAKEASGKKWFAPFLAQLLEDPYSAVRYIAQRALRQLDAAYQGLAYDYVGSPEQRNQARQRVIEIWKSSQATNLDRTGPEVLIDSTGDPKREIIENLSQRRNDQSMDLQE